MKFADRLKSLREENKITQQELANALSISRPTIAGYERGKEPDYETLIRFANYFCVSVDFLIGRTDEKASPEKKKKTREEIEKKIQDINIDEIRIAAHDEGGRFEEAPEGLKKLIRDIIIEVRKEKLGLDE